MAKIISNQFTPAHSAGRRTAAQHSVVALT